MGGSGPRGPRDRAELGGHRVFALAEILVGLESKLADEVVARVRAEIERRIFEPYLARHEQLNWFRGHNNWNGVCNSGVGATFLLLEQDTERLAQALSYVLEGLDVFLSTAFEEEGSSTEGVSYWHYGLSNLIPFAEMLRLRTGGAIDILGMDRLRQIADLSGQADALCRAVCQLFGLRGGGRV